jgi:transposase
LSNPLFLLPTGFRLDHLGPEGDSIAAHLTAVSPSAACPTCGLPSSRVHSRYRRQLADLPSQGRRLRPLLTVRRFFCPAPDCSRRIFTERLPGLAAPRARATASLRHAQAAIGQALGGEVGARLAMPTSPDSLL